MYLVTIRTGQLSVWSNFRKYVLELKLKENAKTGLPNRVVKKRSKYVLSVSIMEYENVGTGLQLLFSVCTGKANRPP